MPPVITTPNPAIPSAIAPAETKQPAAPELVPTATGSSSPHSSQPPANPEAAPSGVEIAQAIPHEEKITALAGELARLTETIKHASPLYAAAEGAATPDAIKHSLLQHSDPGNPATLPALDAIRNGRSYENTIADLKAINDNLAALPPAETAKFLATLGVTAQTESVDALQAEHARKQLDAALHALASGPDMPHKTKAFLEVVQSTSPTQASAEPMAPVAEAPVTAASIPSPASQTAPEAAPAHHSPAHAHPAAPLLDAAAAQVAAQIGIDPAQVHITIGNRRHDHRHHDHATPQPPHAHGHHDHQHPDTGHAAQANAQPGTWQAATGRENGPAAITPEQVAASRAGSQGREP